MVKSVQRMRMREDTLICGQVLVITQIGSWKRLRRMEAPSRDCLVVIHGMIGGK